MFSPEGYQAIAQAAAVVRRADRGVLAVTGGDRLTWLQGLLTNDVAALAVGGVCDAAYLTAQGRMITDMRVVHQAGQTLLDVPAPLAEPLRARLDGLLFSEDAQIADRSGDLHLVEVHGPASAQAVEGLAFVRDDAYGLPGYCAFVGAGDADAIVARLAARGVPETTLETLDVVRVESGRPAFLIDMDEHTIPLEAGLEQRAISFSKGCYVGQEVIVRVMHRGGGRVARKLVGLRFAKGELPAAGATISADGREIGKVTSAVWSPTLDLPIGLGYVHRDFLTAGTPVEVAATSGTRHATVTALPFFERR